MIEYQNSKYKKIAAELIRKIKDGFFVPGSKFLTRDEVSEQYHISYATTHKIFQLLEAEGWIQNVHGKHPFVLLKDNNKISSLKKNASPSKQVKLAILNPCVPYLKNYGTWHEKLTHYLQIKILESGDISA